MDSVEPLAVEVVSELGASPTLVLASGPFEHAIANGPTDRKITTATRVHLLAPLGRTATTLENVARLAPRVLGTVLDHPPPAELVDLGVRQPQFEQYVMGVGTEGRGRPANGARRLRELKRQPQSLS